MLRMCKPIFGSGKAVVLDSGLCVAKGIIDIESKCVYSGDLINKRHQCPKGFPGGLIDTHFKHKEVNGFDILEAQTQENRPFQIFCTKYLDHVMNIMARDFT